MIKICLFIKVLGYKEIIDNIFLEKLLWFESKDHHHNHFFLKS